MSKLSRHEISDHEEKGNWRTLSEKILTKSLFNVMKNVYVSSHHRSETFAPPKAGREKWVHLDQINMKVFR